MMWNTPFLLAPLSLLFLHLAIVVVTAADYDFHDAAQKTKEFQRNERERRRIKEANNRRQGRKEADKENNIWDKHFNESTTGGKFSFNRTVESTEWIVTGTSPILEKPSEEPKRGTLLASKQPPYVHWVCYRGDTAENEITSEKLACCLEIYRAMLQDPESLCWKTDLEACGYNPNQMDPQNIKIDIMADMKEKKQEIAAVRKTEFMQHCTHLLTPIPSTNRAEPDQSQSRPMDYSQDGFMRIPPRWSLLQSPSVLKYKPTNQWRQFVQDKVSGIWIKRSDVSPIHISRPIRMNATSHHRLDVVDTFPIFYTTKLISSNTNDEWRVLEHTLQLGKIDDPPALLLSAKVILRLFLPNELRPIPQKPLSNCAPDCHVSLIADTWSRGKMSVWGQPSVVTIQVDIANVTTRKLSWTTTLRLDDEESLLLSPPLVDFAVMTSKDDDRVWTWDGNVKPTLSLLLTDFEEKERLQDLWKVEL